MVAALACHVLQGSGTFSQNVALQLGTRLSDASLSERRTSLGTAPWKAALEKFLGLLTDGDNAPGASYQGLRLVGVDGTTFNVGNTPTMKA